MIGATRRFDYGYRPKPYDVISGKEERKSVIRYGPRTAGEGTDGKPSDILATDPPDPLNADEPAGRLATMILLELCVRWLIEPALKGYRGYAEERTIAAIEVGAGPNAPLTGRLKRQGDRRPVPVPAAGKTPTERIDSQSQQVRRSGSATREAEPSGSGERANGLERHRQPPGGQQDAKTEGGFLATRVTSFGRSAERGDGEARQGRRGRRFRDRRRTR